MFRIKPSQFSICINFFDPACKAFAKMTNRIKEALINNNVNVDLLIEQLCTISTVKNKDVPLFDDDVFDNKKSIDDFWKILRSFWSIFDYELLQCIVELSKCGEAQRIFKKFLSRFDPSAIRDVDLVLHCKVERPDGLLKPVLRIKVNTKECTADIKKMVEEKVSEIYNLKRYALCFQGIKKGCIELCYYISNTLKGYILDFEVSQDILVQFLTCKIISFHIDEYELMINSEVNDDIIVSVSPV